MLLKSVFKFKHFKDSEYSLEMKPISDLPSIVDHVLNTI